MVGCGQADVFVGEPSFDDLACSALVAVSSVDVGQLCSCYLGSDACLMRCHRYPAHVIRNAIVAFRSWRLRERVKTTNGAFRSRIHVALGLVDPGVSTKTHAWTSFLRRAGVGIGKCAVTQEQLEVSADRDSMEGLVLNTEEQSEYGFFRGQ